jgi:hypothetical protein
MRHRMEVTSESQRELHESCAQFPPLDDVRGARCARRKAMKRVSEVFAIGVEDLSYDTL